MTSESIAPTLSPMTFAETRWHALNGVPDTFELQLRGNVKIVVYKSPYVRPGRNPSEVWAWKCEAFDISGSSGFETTSKKIAVDMVRKLLVELALRLSELTAKEG